MLRPSGAISQRYTRRTQMKPRWRVMKLWGQAR
ncbi:unnamed protein product [Haemonchus placei]|uniref:Uncharacterized protein n=1 Tax=Haemonchus placei TaxID=6290 RepID=A0A0N4W3I1_HAEPC|nr:unnamed protein product [Haemonchus placei]